MTFHGALASFEGLALILFLLITSCLALIFILPRPLNFYSLLATFFLVGMLLDAGQHNSSSLQSLAMQRKRVTIEGTLLEPARVIKEMARLKIRAHRYISEGKPVSVNENLLVSVYSNVPDTRPGERIRFSARLRPFKNFNNPGGYDYERAMKLRGLCCSASVSDGRSIVPVGPGHLPFPLGALERIRRPARDFFAKKLDPADYSLYRALILGERQGISSGLREHFNRTGLGHVLAVSGLHIGLVAWITFFLFKWVLSRFYSLTLATDIRKSAALLTCIPVIGYTLLAGLQVSSQRAMIMVLVFLWSLILGREKEVWSTLGLAGLLILAIDPHALFSISFQLSFSAVIGILWLTPVFLGKIFSPDSGSQGKKTILDRLLAYFAGLIAVSLSAVFFLLPITTFYFHRISMVAIPANVTVVPILGMWVIPFGLLSAVTLPVSAQVADFLLQLGVWGLHGMMDMIRFWSSITWSSSWVVTPNPMEMILFYALILLIFFYGKWQWAKTGVAVLAIVILVDVGYWIHRVGFNKELRVTFLDVGQANAALVQFPDGKKMLIDGGGFPMDRFDVGRMVVAPYLWHSKIRRIDYLVLSHPQADHMNGLRFIAREFHPKEFWHNGDQVEAASFKQLMEIVRVRKIKTLLPADLLGVREINGTRVQVLHPGQGPKTRDASGSGTALNNRSLVLKISYGGKSILFPGDIEREGEENLVSNAGQNLKSDILLSPHHGSRSSSSEEFLRMVSPSICVISSGEGNYFGFPHHQTLERLRSIGCRIIRIGRSGATQCRIAQDLFEIRTFMEDGGF